MLPSCKMTFDTKYSALGSIVDLLDIFHLCFYNNIPSFFVKNIIVQVTSTAQNIAAREAARGACWCCQSVCMLTLIKTISACTHNIT